MDGQTTSMSSSDADLASWLRDTSSEVGEDVSHVDATYDESAVLEDADDEAPAAG